MGDFKKNEKWRREKWRENYVFDCLVEGGKGERFWWVHKFSLSPSSNYNLSTFHFSSITGFLFLFLFFVFSFFGFVGTCWVLLLFLLVLLLFFSFLFFFIFFFKKTLLDDFLCYFLKCSLSSIHNFLKKYNILFFVLFKRDMIVNLYKPYFQPNQKVFHPFTFPPFQPNINEEN